MSALVTLEQAKAYIGPVGSISDDELNLYIETASGLVEAYIGPVSPREVSTVTTYGTTLLEGRVLEVTSVAGVPGSALPYGWSLNAAAGLLAGVYAGSVVTYTVGMDPIPAAVTLAVLWTVQHAFEAQRGTVPTPYDGQDGDTYTTSRAFFMPQRAKEILSPYRTGVAIA